MDTPTIGDGAAASEEKVKELQQKEKNTPPPQSSSLGSGGGSIFNSDRHFIQKYNQLEHDVDLYLDNSGDFTKPKRYHLNPSAILGLELSDTVNDWVVDGSITILYLPEEPPSDVKDVFGQSKNTTVNGIDQAASQNGETLRTYTFRGDGYDLLRVMIIPKTNPSKDASNVTVNKNSTKWMLSYVFSIYDVEDVNDLPELDGNAATYMKCLKLKFHDVRYQMLQTINLEYSTSMPKDKSLTPNFDSEIAKKQGVLYTGDILRDIFNEALAKTENGGHEEFRISADKWDKGKGELFYTSPAQYSAADDIDYVYSHHVSETELQGTDDVKLYDMCLLHTDRADTFGKLEPIVLTPLSEFFKKAGKDTPGELQKEHFFITSLTTEAKNVPKLHRAPIGNSNQDIDLKTDKYGEIISYSFVDMSPIVNSNMFATAPVYSVDIGKREFNVEFAGNDIKSAKKAISKSYISQLYKKGSQDEEKLFLPTIHKSKKDLNLFPTFSLNGNNIIARQKNGIHNLIYTGLFQNACICFKVYGLTWRESGTFIGIDKTEGCADGDYNNKLYGQWFVVRVDHIFQGGFYMNIIYAVKVHRYDVLKASFAGLLE